MTEQTGFMLMFYGPIVIVVLGTFGLIWYVFK